jgi:hypothetical protein
VRPRPRVGGKLRLLVSDVPRAKEALKAAKYRATEEGAVTVAVENRPGTFAGIAEKLAQARINIKCAYVTGEGDKQLIVLSVDRLGPSNGGTWWDIRHPLDHRRLSAQSLGGQSIPATWVKDWLIPYAIHAY